MAVKIKLNPQYENAHIGLNVLTDPIKLTARNVFPSPEHEWQGRQLRLKQPDGSWGQWVDLSAEGQLPDVIIEHDTIFNFPSQGQRNTIYVELSKNKIYRWDDNKLKYYIIGSDYNEIEIINGGVENA